MPKWVPSADEPRIPRSLSHGEVHLWTVPLQSAPDITSELAGILSDCELARAEKMAAPGLRTGSILSRGVLRSLLGYYLGIASNTVEIRYGPNGKPVIQGPVRFNVSHSGSVAAFAFAVGCELGLDVEEIRPFADLAAVAARFFSPEEAEELAKLPRAEQELAFFRCWTRKEAYVKAVGTGLSGPLHDFQVSLQQSEAARFVRLPDGSGPWSLYDVPVPSGYAAALAHAGAARRLEVRQLADVGDLFHHDNC
jgi:4'-phosphopantetheinyl transferase